MLNHSAYFTYRLHLFVDFRNHQRKIDKLFCSGAVSAPIFSTRHGGQAEQAAALQFAADTAATTAVIL